MRKRSIIRDVPAVIPRGWIILGLTAVAWAAVMILTSLILAYGISLAMAVVLLVALVIHAPSREYVQKLLQPPH